MKKFLISILTLIFGILFVFLIVLIIKPKEQAITITSTDKNVSLSLKKYKINDYCLEESDYNQVITFDVKKGVKYYNEVIKKNEYFDDTLILEQTTYRMIGYIVKEDRLFHYSIINNTVEIRSWGTTYNDGYENYYIFVPLYKGLTKDLLKDESKYNMYSHFQDRSISLEYFHILLKKMNENLYKIDNNIIYLKGLSFKDLSLSDEYLVKVIENNGKMYVYNAW